MHRGRALSIRRRCRIIPRMRFCLLVILCSVRIRSAEPEASCGELLWRGQPVAISCPSGERPLDLAPDGSSVLYLQGDPWPRVMLQPLTAGAEPVVLGDHAPFGARSPRFDFEGRLVFFTADLDPESQEGEPIAPAVAPAAIAPGRSRALRTAAVAVDLAAQREHRLFPPAGGEPDAFALFLDVHPTGRTILLGSGRAVTRPEASLGAFSVTLSELNFTDKGEPIVPARPLSLEAPGIALARYSWDGKVIFVVVEAGADQASRVLRYDRATEIQETLAIDPRSLSRLGGDVEIAQRRWPHAGGFGAAQFPMTLLSRAVDLPAVPFRGPERPWGAHPYLPVVVRGERVLLAAGPEDRLEIAVARWDPAALEGALSAASSSGSGPILAPGSFHPGWDIDAVRATGADARVEKLLRELCSSSVLLLGQKVVAAQARWALLSPTRDPQPQPQARRSRHELQALELASGEIRIVRTTIAERPEDPKRIEALAWNGREAWSRAGEGERMALDVAEVLGEAATASPFALLLDPLGLGRAGTHLSMVEEKSENAADGRGTRRAILLLRERSWQARVTVALTETGPLLESIESPAVFSHERVRRNLGDVPAQRSVRFADWKSVAGRRVPGRVTFLDGLNDVELVLEELLLNPKDARAAIER